MSDCRSLFSNDFREDFPILKKLALECSLGGNKLTYWRGNPLGKAFDKSLKDVKSISFETHSGIPSMGPYLGCSLRQYQ